MDSVNQRMVAQDGYRKQRPSFLNEIFPPGNPGVAVRRHGNRLNQRGIGKPWQGGDKDFIQNLPLVLADGRVLPGLFLFPDRVGNSFLTATIVYWAAILIYAAVILGIAGVEGGSLPIQMEHWYTMYNFNQVQTFAVTVLAGYVGTLFSSACAMLISAKTRSTVLAITVPFILTCVSPFVGRIPVLTRASSLFPDMLFRLNTEMNGFLLYRIGGNIFSQFSVILVMYLILTCVLFPLLYVLYRNS